MRRFGWQSCLPPRISAEDATLDTDGLRAIEDRVAEALDEQGVEIVRLDDEHAARSCEDALCRKRTLRSPRVTHALRVDIGGKDRLYDVGVSLFDASSGAQVGETRTKACTVCGRSDLAELAASEAVALRDTSLPATQLPPRPLVLQTREERKDVRKHRPWRRPLAISAVAGGLALTTAGAALIGLDGRDDASRCSNPENVDADGDCRFVRRTLAPGVVTALAGAGLTATGITVLVLDRPDGRRRADVKLSATTRSVIISGRF